LTPRGYPGVQRAGAQTRRSDAYRDEIIDELKAKTGRKKGTTESFKQSAERLCGRTAEAGDAFGSGGTRLRLVYAEGEIV